MIVEAEKKKRQGKIERKYSQTSVKLTPVTKNI